MALTFNPDAMISFASLRSARSFVRGYVGVSRVVAHRPGHHDPHQRFVICHPATAKRRGWRVVA